MSINKAILKVAQANPEFRKALTAELKKARNTVPPLEMKYYDLGDFGGTQRSLENWVLEVGGPTWRIKDELKRAKLRWDPERKVWGLRATLYAAGMMGRPAQNFARIRKLQQAAHKMLKPVLQAENNIIEAENEGVTGPAKKKTVRELMQMVRRNERVRNSLKDNYGISMEYDFKGRYDQAGTEAQIFLVGDTFGIKDVLKKFGFHWDSSKKGWKLPYMEYEAVKKKLVPALMRALSSGKTAYRAETPLEKSLWHTWDVFQGTERVRHPYLDALQGIGMDASTSDLADSDPSIHRLGETLLRAARSMEKQSRSWRTAYNLSVEGKIQLDGPRLAKDLTKTLVAIQKAEKVAASLFKKLAGATSEYPDTLDMMKKDMYRFISLSKSMAQAFQRTIQRALKA